jgi:hypothetical protein
MGSRWRKSVESSDATLDATLDSSYLEFYEPQPNAEDLWYEQQDRNPINVEELNHDDTRSPFHASPAAHEPFSAPRRIELVLEHAAVAIDRSSVSSRGVLQRNPLSSRLRYIGSIFDFAEHGDGGDQPH